LHWTVSWMYAFVLVPRSIRNSVYDFISRNRIRWFGKYKNQVSGSRTQDNVTK
jgi:predicted DCC family thiol-disulfide oxidoreductase YuxK